MTTGDGLAIGAGVAASAGESAGAACPLASEAGTAGCAVVGKSTGGAEGAGDTLVLGVGGLAGAVGTGDAGEAAGGACALAAGA